LNRPTPTDEIIENSCPQCGNRFRLRWVWDYPEREANHLLTLVTTNRNPADLEDAPPRTIDRFRNKRFGHIALNQATSFRRRKD